ncbi:MAG: Dioxygenase [Labilithrix sp.]|nr:Dioxygenase [Labilithrix sp.]
MPFRSSSGVQLSRREALLAGHIHVKLRAAAHALLATQLYFPDDPYNEIRSSTAPW